jgi:hypothetical protein
MNYTVAHLRFLRRVQLSGGMLYTEDMDFVTNAGIIAEALCIHTYAIKEHERIRRQSI